MKKIVCAILTILMSFSLIGCSNNKNPNYQIAEGIDLELQDVLKAINKDQNTIYYYYLMNITNSTDEDYLLNEFTFEIRDNGQELKSYIDQDYVMPTQLLTANTSGYICGYIGFPNNDQKDIGLFFNDDETFMSFKNVKIREASSKDVASTQKGMKQKLFSDKAMAITYDYSQANVGFEFGNTVVSNFILQYENKTDEKIVVPYIEPKGVLNGLLETDYADKANFEEITIDKIKKLDVKKNKKLPEMKQIEGQASGYALIYLEPHQIINVATQITFNNSFICYQNTDETPIQIKLVNPGLGINTTVYVSRDAKTPEIQEQ